MPRPAAETAIRLLPLAQAEEFMKRLGVDAADDSVFRARDAQLPPHDLNWSGFSSAVEAGKSHSMSAAVHMAVRAGISRIHLIAPTTAEFHDVNLEGRSGILATCGRNPRPRWIASKRRLGGQTARCMCASPAKSPSRCAARMRVH